MILAIIFVPRIIHHTGTSGTGAACADVGTAYRRYGRTAGSMTGLDVAPSYRQLGDDLDTAAQKATDPGVRSAIQNVADAGHAVADDVDREHASSSADSSDYNRDIAKWSTAHDHLLEVCK